MKSSCSAAVKVVRTRRRELTERKYLAKRRSKTSPFKEESVMKVSYLSLGSRVRFF